MAGTFRIFSESENIYLNDISHKTTSKSKSIGNAGVISSKIHSQFKSKGLSIRSKSDLNVSGISNSKLKATQEKDFLKKEDNGCVFQKMSPNKIKAAKNQLTYLAKKICSPKKMSPKQNVKNFIFAKPATPKYIKKKYPEPQKLYYDFDQNKFMIEEMNMIYNKDLDWVRSVRKFNGEMKDEQKICDDEGFISGGEIDSFEINFDIVTPCLSDVELPELSDSDDEYCKN